MEEFTESSEMSDSSEMSQASGDTLEAKETAESSDQLPEIIPRDELKSKYGSTQGHSSFTSSYSTDLDPNDLESQERRRMSRSLDIVSMSLTDSKESPRSPTYRSKNKPSTGSPKPNLKWQSAFRGIEENFHKIGNKTYLFRMIVVGEYEGSSTELVDWNDLLISRINANTFDEIATGFFLLYPRHFVHILEGSESVLDMYLDATVKEFDREIPSERGTKSLFVGKIVILGYFAIKQRKVLKWICQRHPPIELDGNENLSEEGLFGFTKRTIMMGLVAGKQIAFQNEKEVSSYAEEVKGQGQGSGGVRSVFQMIAAHQLKEYLPSERTLDGLLSEVERYIPLPSPAEFIRVNWVTPNVHLASETDWPVHGKNASYD